MTMAVLLDVVHTVGRGSAVGGFLKRYAVGVSLSGVLPCRLYSIPVAALVNQEMSVLWACLPIQSLNVLTTGDGNVCADVTR